MNRNRRGNGSPSLKLGRDPAVPPSRKDEVGPDEDVSGKQHAEDELEEEDELIEGSSVGGDKGRDSGSGGNVVLGNVGPLPLILLLVAVAGIGRELVTTNSRLLLCLRLGTTLDLALVEAALDSESESIWNLYCGSTCARS